MKKFVLIFSASYTDFPKISSLKAKVKEYFGERMILDSCEGLPRLDVKHPLDNDDYSKLVELTNNCDCDSSQIFIIESSEEFHLDTSIVLTKVSEP